MLWDDRYRIERMLGEGGRGRVSLAVDEKTKRRVALKNLLWEAQAYVDEFEREFCIHHLLGKHQNIPSAHEYFVRQVKSCEGVPYFTMDLVEDSVPLYIFSRRTQDRLGAVRLVIPGILRALDHLHRFGLVHRDLKPGNILVQQKAKRSYLIDFGAVASVNQSSCIFFGTPAYSAPELLAGEDLDHRCDLYALGLVIYEIITCRRPWRGHDEQQLLDDRMYLPYPALPEWCPPLLVELVDDLLKPETDDRPESAKVVFDRLAKALGLEGEKWNHEPLDVQGCSNETNGNGTREGSGN